MCDCLGVALTLAAVGYNETLLGRMQMQYFKLLFQLSKNDLFRTVRLNSATASPGIKVK